MVSAVAEASLVHAVYAVDDRRLSDARNHLAPGEARLERDFGGAVVIVGSEVHAVLLAFFGIVCSKSEKFRFFGDCRRTVGIDHAAHAAVHAAFHDDDTAGNVDVSITVDAVRVASADVDVVVTAGNLERARASAESARESAAATGTSASVVASVISARRCRCAAGRVPAVVRGDDARDAAFKVHVGRFHSFVGHGNVDVCVVLDVERFLCVYAVVVSLDGHFPAADSDVPATVDSVVAATDFNDATANDNARITLDSFHARIGGAGVSLAKSHASANTSASATAAGVLTETVLASAGRNLDGRDFGFAICFFLVPAIGNRDAVVGGDAVKCGRDGDFAARDFDGTFAVFQICGVIGVALDAVATGRGDVDCAAADIYGTFSLETVVLCGYRDKSVLDSKVVAGVDAVVVVALYDKCAFAFDREIVLGVDAGACRIALGLACVIGVGVRCRSCRGVAKRVGRAVLCDDERLVRFLDVNRGVGRVGQREAFHVQVNGGVRLCRCDENLAVVSAIAAAKVVFAAAGNLDGSALDGDAVSSVGDRGAACGVRDDGTVFGVVINLFGLVARRAWRSGNGRAAGNNACAAGHNACATAGRDCRIAIGGGRRRTLEIPCPALGTLRLRLDGAGTGSGNVCGGGFYACVVVEFVYRRSRVGTACEQGQ